MIVLLRGESTTAVSDSTSIQSQIYHKNIKSEIIPIKDKRIVLKVWKTKSDKPGKIL